MKTKGWVCILFALFTLAWTSATKNQGIVELLQELQKEPLPEQILMFHEVGSILDDTWNPVEHDPDTAGAHSQSDLVQPHEQHLDGVPVFIQQPKSVYYVWAGKPAVFECVAEPVSHAVVFCADNPFPYKGNEHTQEQRLQVTRLDANGKLNAEGSRWHIRLLVEANDLEEWFDAYVCRCEVWNVIPALKLNKKVFSQNASIIEAYLNREFQLEPHPEQLVQGQRLLLSCQPPKGEPVPKVYWLKDGKRVNSQTFPRIIIDEYNRLIIEQVELNDNGNYTCVAESLGMEQRHSIAEVTVLRQFVEANEDKNQTSFSMNVRETMFYVGLTTAFTLTTLIICTVCRLSTSKASSLCTNGNEKPMSILKNSQIGPCDMPVADGSLSRSLKVSEPSTPQLFVESQKQPSVSSTEAANVYNQPYSPAALMSSVLSNGSSFHSPTFEHPYRIKESGNLSSLAITGYANPALLTNSITPQSQIRLIPSNSSVSSSTCGLQIQPQHHQPIYLSPSSTPNRGLGSVEREHSCSSVFYHEIRTADESVFPLIPPLPISAAATAAAKVGSVGGVISLPDPGVSLRIPPGSIPSGAFREVHLATCRDERCWPALSERKTLLSSVIQVGLLGTPFLKPVIVTFPHCATMTGHGIWSFSIHCYCTAWGFNSIFKHAADTTAEWSWREVSKVGHEQARDPIHCYLKGNQAHLMIQYPLRFCLIGQAEALPPNTNPKTPMIGVPRMGISTDGSENHSGSIMGTEATNDATSILSPLSKRLQLIVFISRFTNATDCSVRIYCVLDIPDSVRQVKDTEAKLNSRLLSSGKLMIFKNNAGGLVLRIQELSTSWRTRLSCQEIPFRHIWNGSRNALLHCSFTLKRVDDSTQGLRCVIACQQEGVSGTQQVLHLNVNSDGSEGNTSHSNHTGSSPHYEETDFRLPNFVVFKLCRLLDPIVPIGNDWRQLAQHLNMERFVPYFASTQHPTEMVLSLWEVSTSARTPLAIQELINILQGMRRLDCVTLIRSHALK